MRVLGRIRLSRLTDESTSAARQRQLIEQWADAGGHTIVGYAEDLDVSGSIDPFDTPSLGGWLTQEKAEDWDCLVAWKLDRLGRDSIRLNKLFGWCLDNGKSLVSCTEGIDLSTPVGRLIANVIAFLAEGERLAIVERTRASRKKLLEDGRWPGGKPPYGLVAKQIPGGGWKLHTDPDTAPVVHRIVAEVTAGKPVEAVTRELNEAGIPAPRGGAWTKASVWHIVEAKYLLGHATYQGQTVRDRLGNAVFNAEPLVTQKQWDDLQTALAARRNKPQRSRKASPLLGVLLCMGCGKPLHHRVHTKDSGVYRYYYCEQKHTATIVAQDAEADLETAFLIAVGDKTVWHKIFIPAENHQLELEEAQRAVDELTDILGSMKSNTVRSRLAGQIEALDNRIMELEKLPSRAAKWEYVDTGVTYRAVWEMSDQPIRRQLLLDSGITYKIHRKPNTQVVLGELYVPEEILTNLNEKTPLPNKG